MSLLAFFGVVGTSSPSTEAPLGRGRDRSSAERCIEHSTHARLLWQLGLPAKALEWIALDGTGGGKAAYRTELDDVPFRRAVLSSKVDDPQVEIIPVLLGEDILQITLRVLHFVAVAEAPAIRESMNVGVHGKAGYTKSLGHDNRCGLVAHTTERFQFFKTGRNLGVVSFWFAERGAREQALG